MEPDFVEIDFEAWFRQVGWDALGSNDAVEAVSARAKKNQKAERLDLKPLGRSLLRLAAWGQAAPPSTERVAFRWGNAYIIDQS